MCWSSAKRNGPPLIFSPVAHGVAILCFGLAPSPCRDLHGRKLLQLVPSSRCSSTLNVDRETLAVAWDIGHLPRDRTQGLSISTGDTVLFVTAGVNPEQNRRAQGCPSAGQPHRLAGSTLPGIGSGRHIPGSRAAVPLLPTLFARLVGLCAGYARITTRSGVSEARKEQGEGDSRGSGHRCDDYFPHFLGSFSLS